MAPSLPVQIDSGSLSLTNPDRQEGDSCPPELSEPTLPVLSANQSAFYFFGIIESALSSSSINSLIRS